MANIPAIKTTIIEGEVQADLALFNGQEVIILAKEDFNQIAGSDSARFQLDQAKQEIERLTALLEVTE